MPHERYTTTVIVGRRTISLLEPTLLEDMRALRLWIDGIERGELQFPHWWVLPGIAVANSDVAVWSDLDFYLTSLDTGPVRHYPQEWPIRAAYPVAGYWCLICELYVVLLDPRDGYVAARWWSSDVIVSATWSGDDLIIEEWDGRRTCLRPLEGSAGFVPEVIQPAEPK